jgi:hypothetical protein
MTTSSKDAGLASYRSRNRASWLGSEFGFTTDVNSGS